jgi:FPC/CPF motif-containing protein YcgG
LERYEQKFWTLLKGLEAHDQTGSCIAKGDPDSKDWEFTFAREPMFVFTVNPAYRQRRSRNMGGSFAVLFQPRRVFGVLDDSATALAPARKEIRRRLQAWDRMPAHPDLGVFGNETNREWKSYFLPDDDEPVVGICPLAAAHEASGENAPSGVEPSLDHAHRAPHSSGPHIDHAAGVAARSEPRRLAADDEDVEAVGPFLDPRLGSALRDPGRGR